MFLCVYPQRQCSARSGDEKVANVVEGEDSITCADRMTTPAHKASSSFTRLTCASASPEQGNQQLESRMREIRPSGSDAGGGREISS